LGVAGPPLIDAAGKMAAHEIGDGGAGPGEHRDQHGPVRPGRNGVGDEAGRHRQAADPSYHWFAGTGERNVEDLDAFAAAMIDREKAKASGAQLPEAQAARREQGGIGRPRAMRIGRTIWRDLIGYYTRFGDVRELLAQVDDRYVIMNAGDEMSLRFPEQPPPPAGWVRDYVIMGDGWIKDGDYNSTWSKTVVPLPYHARQEYTTAPGKLEDEVQKSLSPQFIDQGSKIDAGIKICPAADFDADKFFAHEHH